VERLKKEEVDEEALRKALEKSEYGTCPICGDPPKEIHYNGLPLVQCEHNYEKDGYRHTWSLETGLTDMQQRKRDQTQYLKDNPEIAEEEKAKTKEKFKPQSFRYPLERETIHLQLSKRVIKAVSALQSLESINVKGYDQEGNCISFDMSRGWYSEEVSKKDPDVSWWSRETISKISFQLEEKVWKIDHVNKVKVNCNTSDEKELQRMREFLESLTEETK